MYFLESERVYQLGAKLKKVQFFARTHLGRSFKILQLCWKVSKGSGLLRYSSIAGRFLKSPGNSASNALLANSQQSVRKFSQLCFIAMCVLCVVPFISK
jgi:hypothetical protein